MGPSAPSRSLGVRKGHAIVIDERFRRLVSLQEQL